MRVHKLGRQQKVVIGILATFAVVVAGASLSHGLQVWRQKGDRQAEVAAKGAQVMPFDLEQTTHSFEPKADGGLQTVVADDPQNQAQIDLIQVHLKEEATKFQAGDFSDPATIHGKAMPGLSELSAGYSAIQIAYSPTSGGGQIRYTAQSDVLVKALHAWFAAQRSDHGRHAH